MLTYMAVTPDKYEIPLAIKDSGKEMAAFLKCNVSTLYSIVNRGSVFKGFCRVVRVEV